MESVSSAHHIGMEKHWGEFYAMIWNFFKYVNEYVHKQSFSS